MKLATLAPVVKTAYRGDEIDTATAEAFSAVPNDRQITVWTELNGQGGPRNAEQVRNIIAHEWIDAVHALFDVSALPASAVSSDLFSQKVLIERQAFMAAQTDALATEREKLIEEGWKEVVAGGYDEVRDRLFSMDKPEREFDEATTRMLGKIAARQAKLQARAEKIEAENTGLWNRLQLRFEELQAKEQEIIAQAPVYVSEETKAVGTAFLMLLPDGEIRRDYRLPPSRRRSGNGNGQDGGNGEHGGEGVSERPKPPTSDDLADRQLAATFTHQALAVREALLKNDRARKRILALILHEKVQSEALAVSHEPNGTTLHASQGETFTSAAFDRLRKQRAKLDPFGDAGSVEDRDGYDPTHVPSTGGIIFDLHLVDAIAGQLALGIVTAGADNRMGRLIRQLGNRNLLQVKMDPDYRLNGKDIFSQYLGNHPANFSFTTIAFRRCRCDDSARRSTGCGRPRRRT